MGLESFNAYHSYLKAIEPLNDAERGRLFTACLEYSMTGVAPELKGNERFVFPSMAAQIDRDKEKYTARCRKNSENVSKRWNTNVYDGTSRIRNDTNYTKDKDKDKDKDYIPPISPSGDISPQRGEPTAEKRKRFVAPTVEEVGAYCAERGNHVDPQRFVDFYTANGWTQGRGKPIKDWRAAVRTWEARDKQAAPVQRPVLTDDDYDLDKFF